MRNMYDWVQDIILSPERKAIPIMTHPGIENIGKTVREAVTDGNIHYQAIKALDEDFPSAACTVIMDLTVEAEAFGARVIFPEDEIPTVSERLLHNEKEIDQLVIPDINQGRIPEYIKANKLAVENIDNPVFAGCIGPFSLAGRLYDMSEIMIACYCEPEATKKLLEKCTVFLKKYCKALKEQGVQGIVIAEPAAGLLSPDGCEEFSSVYIKEIVDELQDENFIVILHNCGNKGHCTAAMVKTGAKGYHFGNQMDMIQALEECPDNVLVLGNIDPVGLFKNGTIDELRTACSELLEKTSTYPNFVLSTGCDVPPHAPMENIRTFYNTLSEYNRKNKSTSD